MRSIVAASIIGAVLFGGAVEAMACKSDSDCEAGKACIAPNGANDSGGCIRMAITDKKGKTTQANPKGKRPKSCDECKDK